MLLLLHVSHVASLSHHPLGEGCSQDTHARTHMPFCLPLFVCSSAHVPDRPCKPATNPCGAWCRCAGMCSCCTSRRTASRSLKRRTAPPSSKTAATRSVFWHAYTRAGRTRIQGVRDRMRAGRMRACLRACVNGLVVVIVVSLSWSGCLGVGQSSAKAGCTSRRLMVEESDLWFKACYTLVVVVLNHKPPAGTTKRLVVQESGPC